MPVTTHRHAVKFKLRLLPLGVDCPGMDALRAPHSRHPHRRGGQRPPSACAPAQSPGASCRPGEWSGWRARIPRPCPPSAHARWSKESGERRRRAAPRPCRSGRPSRQSGAPSALPAIDEPTTSARRTPTRDITRAPHRTLLARLWSAPAWRRMSQASQ